MFTVVKICEATFSKAIALSLPSLAVENGLKVLILILVLSNPKISITSSLLTPASTSVVSGVITVAEEASAFITIFSTLEPDMESTVETT